MKRIKLTFCYNGARFFGSQTQNNTNTPTVMQTMQRSFSSLGVSDRLQASGRTDKGVHASNQTAHIDIPSYLFDLNKLKNNLNKMISPYIYIKKIEFKDDGFHARFSAKKRLYRYIISHDEYDPCYCDHKLFLPKLDIRSIQENIQEFEGTHDFEYFKKQGSETDTYIRTIFKAGAYTYKNHTVIYFLGSGFLRSQIRMMCDFLLKIEKNILTKEDLRKQLNKEENINQSLIEPQGLYLAKIFY